MKSNPFQLSAVHKLYPLAEFSLLKAVLIGDLKMLIQQLNISDAVDPVDGGKQVVWIFKGVLVLQKCGQVKIVL